MKNIDKYLFQALDNYPYSLVETVESLDYALSFDSRNTTALILYGRIQMEQLHDYEESKRYFQEVLAIDINSITVYPHYLDVLLLNEDYQEATKLIDFALTVKGIDKVAIMIRKTLLFEKQSDFKKALKVLKEIKLLTTSNCNNHDVEQMEERLKSKIKLIKPKHKPKNGKKDNAKKKKV